LATQASVGVPAGAGGHGNFPAWLAVPEPVLGSVPGAGHDAGRLSTTADRDGSMACGNVLRTAGVAADDGAAADDKAAPAGVAAGVTTGVTKAKVTTRPMVARERAMRGALGLNDRPRSNAPP
jgi:hypothetical protein